MIMSSRALALFLGSLLFVSWGLQFVALDTVGDVRSKDLTPWLIGLMFAPMLWSVAYLALFNRQAWRLIRFWPGNPLYLVLGALIPAGLAFATLYVSLQQGWGGSSYFTFAADGANVVRGPWVMGAGQQDWLLFAVNVAATALLFACVNSIAAVGEEFGWRGVLQHHMIERMGFWPGVAVLGFVWGIWHAPINLAGYNYGAAPELGALIIFPIELIAISFIMAWLTIRARSFWPAVLMHGSGNGIEDGVISSIVLGAGVHPLTAHLTQLGFTIALALVCYMLTPHAIAPAESVPAGADLNRA